MMDEELSSAEDEAYYRALYDIEKAKSPSDLFTEWLYEKYPIGNGHMLLDLMESTTVQDIFLRDSGLPEDTEL